MINYGAIEARKEQLREAFWNGIPFPHCVIDEFFEEEVAHAIHDAFPPLDASFTARVHLHSKKYTNNKWETFPGAISKAFHSLHSDRFLNLLESITNIPKLYPDPDLFGGGMHVSVRGGFLDIHADFTEHSGLQLKRALNILVYFNREWKPEWGGQLELWDKGMQRCVKMVSPDFNRAVIFETSLSSFHGHPAPLACPEGVGRMSLAAYYYRDWASVDEPRLKTTDYKLRSSDYGKRARKALKRVLGARLSAWLRSRFLRV